MKKAETWEKKWGRVAVGVTGVQESIPKEGRGTGWLCRHLPPAPELRPLWQDRWLVAVLLLLTSALFRSPFSHSFISCRHCSFPTGPLTAQLAGVAVRSQSQLSPSPALLPFPMHFHTIWYGKVGVQQVTGIGDRWTEVHFNFFIGVIWPSSSTGDRRGCPFDF